MQWLQDPNRSNIDNLNSVRREASRCFRDKKKEYLKAKLNELELTVKSTITDTCIWASLILRWVTSLEVICIMR